MMKKMTFAACATALVATGNAQLRAPTELIGLDGEPCVKPTTTCTLLDGIRPPRDANGCPTCSRPTDCPARDTLPACTVDCLTSPADCVDGLCPKCKPQLTCTRPTENCAGDLTRDASGCPTCLPPIELKPTCDFRSLTECAPNTRPEFKDGCPTCKPPLDVCLTRPDCSATPDCKAGEFPTRGPDCCPTCKISLTAITDQQAACLDQRDTCRAFLTADDTPECTRDATNLFDRDACCLVCKPPLPPIGDRPDANTGRCTAEQFRACLADKPVCTDDAAPINLRDAQSCCISCQRPERLCTVQDVAECRASRRDCEQGEFPQHVLGECCATCKPPRPTCEPACGDDQICHQTRSGNVCIAKLAIPIRVKVADVARRAAFRKLDAEGVRAVIAEIIERHCENPDNAERCHKFKVQLLAALRVRIEKRGDGDQPDDIVVEVADGAGDANGGNRRLLSAQTLLEDAMKDEGAAAGYTTVGGGDNEATVDSAASVATFSFGALLAAAATAFARAF